MELSNCSLLDEATAAAESMTMMFGLRSKEMKKAGMPINYLSITRYSLKRRMYW